MPVDLSTLSAGTYNIKGAALINPYDLIDCGEGTLMQVEVHDDEYEDVHHKVVLYMGGYWIYEKNGSTYEYSEGDFFETTANNVDEIDVDYEPDTYPSVEAIVNLLNNENYGTAIEDGILKAKPTYFYADLSNDGFISKGTLENVLDERIGDIESILEELDIGGGV